MSLLEDGVLVADAIRQLHAAAERPWPPPANRIIVPVKLDDLIGAHNLTHAEVPALSRAAAGEYLTKWEIERPELREDNSPLAGFLFANARGGYILVNAGDPLPRRRFTAAHELGHYLLHFLPMLEATRDPEAFLVQDDKTETVREEEKPSDDKALSLSKMERQANRFAAELLMPESLCRAAWEQYQQRFRVTERILEHHLARDLLVSQTAVRWRLRNLNLAR